MHRRMAHCRTCDHIGSHLDARRLGGTATLQDRKPISQRRQNSCRLVVLGGSIRNRCRLVIHLRPHMLLCHVDVSDRSVEQNETRLDLYERSACLIHCFPHRIKDELGLWGRLRKKEDTGRKEKFRFSFLFLQSSLLQLICSARFPHPHTHYKLARRPTHTHATRMRRIHRQTCTYISSDLNLELRASPLVTLIRAPARPIFGPYGRAPARNRK
jgi:hypothetical protein